MRGAAVAALALLALAQAASRGAQTAGRITATVGESGDVGPTPRLVVMDADGANARVRLGWVLSASLSPDGASVAYVSRTNPTSVWVAGATARGAGRRVVDSAYAVDWSPRGDAIAFVRSGGSCCGGELWTEDLRTHARRRVVRNAVVADWSPDARSFAFVRGGATWIVARAGGQARRVIADSYDPRWSPDGRRIAFIREANRTSFVYVANVDGTAVHRVVEGRDAAWSPDGSELAVAQQRRIVRVRPDGTQLRVVHRGCCAFGDIDWR